MTKYYLSTSSKQAIQYKNREFFLEIKLIYHSKDYLKGAKVINA